VLIVLVSLSPPWRPPARLCSDALPAVALPGGGVLLVATGGAPGSFPLFTGLAAAAAAVLLLLAGVAGTDRRAALAAAAVGLPALITVLRPAVVDRAPIWALLGSLALLGGLALVVDAGPVLLGRTRSRRVGPGPALAALGLVLAGLAGVAATGAALPSWVPPPALLVGCGLLGYLGAVAAAIVLLVAGIDERRPGLRRLGSGVGLGALAQSVLGGSASEVVGPGLALGAAALVLVGAVAGVPGQVSRRPVEAGRPSLRHPAGKGGRRTGRGPAAVEPIVGAVALRHRETGQDVQVEVFGEPWVRVETDVLATLLTILLANCARHAPAAQVRVRATGCGPRVRIEVVDDGPGLPPGLSARLLRRGVRGPGSTGAGVGLAVCAELAQRHRGSFTVISTGDGCRAVLEFPAARRAASTEVVST
jgi:anti-sigma regulatory factor (Ser/Thr protein kinase)